MPEREARGERVAESEVFGGRVPESEARGVGKRGFWRKDAATRSMHFEEGCRETGRTYHF